MKKNIVQKVCYVVTILMVLAIVRNISTTIVKANNHNDTRYQFDLDTATYPQKNLRTPTRTKTDYSSVYIYNDKSTSDISSILIFGENGKKQEDCTWRKEGVPTCARGERKYLKNWVKEKGYTGAYLWIEPVSPYSIHLNFLWSPDSI